MYISYSYCLSLIVYIYMRVCLCIQVTNEYTASQKFRPYAVIDHETGKLVPLVRIMTFIGLILYMCVYDTMYTV